MNEDSPAIRRALIRTTLITVAVCVGLFLAWFAGYRAARLQPPALPVAHATVTPAPTTQPAPPAVAVTPPLPQPTPPPAEPAKPPTEIAKPKPDAPLEAWTDALDLMPLIDPQKDAVSGAWRLEDGLLTSDNTSMARLEIPYQPPDEYDFRIVFTRAEGNDTVGQFLAARDHQFLWLMGGWKNTIFGFDLIADASANVNPTAVPAQSCLINGKQHTSLVKIRRAAVSAFLDGQPIINWKTDYSDMSVFADWQLRDNRALGLFAYESRVLFHRVELLEVTGKGKFSRPDDPAAKEAIRKREVLKR